MTQLDLLIHSAAQIVTCASPRPKRGEAMTDVGIIPDGAIGIKDGKIVAIGPSGEIRAHHSAGQEIDASGRAVCPGFVDPHTHVVYAGDRVNEFEMRVQGASYMDIMAAGGGINATTQATRAASLDDLIAETHPRLDMMLELGTTTAEVKTGYGLNTENEIKMLRAIEALDESHPIDLVPTFLGAHAIPAEFKANPAAYTYYVIDEMLPAAAQWYAESSFRAREVPFFVDVFCEQNAFDLGQSRRILTAGSAHGMQIKAHVDEFTCMGGVGMGIELGATSLDHLDVTPPADVQKLANAHTIGVVIPAVNFNLGSTEFAAARAMLDSGVALALTTDINPGSAPCPSMPLVMAIASRYQGLLPAEALNASTINAAFAIGLGERVGSLEVGKQADVLILKTDDYRHLIYQFGGNLVDQVVKKGEIL